MQKKNFALGYDVDLGTGFEHIKYVFHKTDKTKHYNVTSNEDADAYQLFAEVVEE